MRKIILTILLLIVTTFTGQAFGNTINKAIADSGINKSAISISIKDVSTGATVYELNSKTPTPPASTLKLVTFTSALNTLGKNYEFTTGLYKGLNNELYLKLGADPYLTAKELNKLFESARLKNIIEPKAIYIDDMILDTNEWGEGWQWDDDLNPLMPKFSSYNLDGNLLNIIIDPKKKGAPASIRLSTFYPVTFMNLTVSSDKNSIEILRNNHIAPDVITIKGEVDSRIQDKIPVNSPKRYFIIKLEEAISSAKLGYYGAFPQKKLPSSNVTLVSEIQHPINPVLKSIYKSSDNMMAETLFKVAGGKFVNNTGSIKSAISMFDEYCKKHNLNNENIRITDGSGVSKNNLRTADFMTDFLVLQAERPDFENFMTMLPTAGEGTLSNRMLYFKDVIYAKTGTLSDISAICGYIKTRNGNLVAFDIMINDAKLSSSDKKATEEQIIRAIYNKY